MKKVVGLLCLVLSWKLQAQVSRNFRDDLKPKYELGAGIISFNIPDYPGSSNNQFRVIPFPWVIYRGDILRMDDEGTRARLSSNKNYEFGFTGGFNFPVESAENPARTGMPDLDALVGFGPSIIWRFFTDHPRHRLNMSLGLRHHISTDLNERFRSEGWALEPSFVYWLQLFESKRLTFFTGMNFLFSDNDYNDYFYGVGQEFASTSRPAFRAQGGLNQVTTFAGLAYQFTEKIQAFTGAFHNNLGWAKNHNSPLVEKEHNLGFLLGFFWLFLESDQKVGI